MSKCLAAGGTPLIPLSRENPVISSSYGSLLRDISVNKKLITDKNKLSGIVSKFHFIFKGVGKRKEGKKC